MTTVALVVALLAGAACGQPAPQPSSGGQPSTGPSARSTVPDRVNWWNDRVFYELFVRSFADSKSGPLAGDGIGDLQGLIEHLDYLNDGNVETTTDLGIGGIRLLPIQPSPGADGYDVTDHYGVNPQYGTIDDFKRLLGECRKRRIKVIVDFVMNHVSSSHEWFKDAADPKSPKHDWFIWSELDPGWDGPWHQRVWHPLAPGGPMASTGYYYGLYSHTMPDLNFRNPAVGEAMKSVTLAWVSSYGVDGVCLDAAAHLIEEGQVQEHTPSTHAWLRDWFLEFKGINLDGLSIGAVRADSEQTSKYVGDEVDLAYESALADAMIESVTSGTKEAFVAAQKKVLEIYQPNQYVRFFSNHGQARVMARLKDNPGAMRTAAALLLTGPGVPFVSYGDEIGMTGDARGGLLRTPMPWTGGPNAGFTTGAPWAAVTPGFESLNVERQSVDPNSLLNFYRKLIHLRNGNPAIATGGTWMVETDKPEVVAFLRQRVWRWKPDMGPDARGSGGRPIIDTVLVIINVSDKPVDDCTLSLESSPLRGEHGLEDKLGSALVPPLKVEERGGFSGYRVGAIAPRSAAVFVLSPK